MQRTYPVPYSILITITIIITLSTHLSFSRNNALFNILRTCFMVATGALSLAVQHQNYEQSSHVIQGKNLSFQAIIQHKDISLSEKCITPKTHSIIRDTTHGLSFLCIFHGPCSFQVGDLVEVNNVTISPPTSHQQFKKSPSFQDYLVRENLLGVIYIFGTTMKLVSRPPHSLFRSLSLCKEKLYQGIKNKISSLSWHYFSLLFLGNKIKQDITEQKNLFTFWGISHYLARSGLHLVLFLIIWTFFLQFLPLPFLLKQGILLCACLIFHILSVPSLSFYRALSLVLLYQAGIFLHHITSPLHLLSLVCLTTLVLNPIRLFFLDFHLTFALTYSMLFFLKGKRKTGMHSHERDLPILPRKK